MEGERKIIESLTDHTGEAEQENRDNVMESACVRDFHTSW